MRACKRQTELKGGQGENRQSERETETATEGEDKTGRKSQLRREEKSARIRFRKANVGGEGASETEKKEND